MNGRGVMDPGRRGTSLKRLLGAASAVFCILLVLSVDLGCRKSQPVPKGSASVLASRIVSLSPSTTETLFLIGAGEKVVGRSRYCNFPKEAGKLPQVGGYTDPSFEAILALRPDLVTGARGPAGNAMAARLEARGIQTFLPKTESFAEIEAMIRGVGERTGNREGAEAQVEGIKARSLAVEKALAHVPRVRVLLVFGLDPVSVAGPSSFADEIIRRAGGTNAVREGGAYPTIGVEHVLTLDPDVVVDASMAESEAEGALRGSEDRIGMRTPGWSGVRAVRERRVVTLRDESLLRPGPRIGEGLQVLARALHPDVAFP